MIDLRASQAAALRPTSRNTGTPGPSDAGGRGPRETFLSICFWVTNPILYKYNGPPADSEPRTLGRSGGGRHSHPLSNQAEPGVGL